MINENQEYEPLTNNMVIVVLCLLLGGLAGALTMLLPVTVR